MSCHLQRTDCKSTAIFIIPQEKACFLVQRIAEEGDVVLRDGAAAQDDEALHDVVQLADVARPLVLLHGLHGTRVEVGCSLAHVLRDQLDEVVHQQWDVVLALTQRRHLDDDDAQTMVEIFPEIALHITRPIRWDSDHVVLFDDETKEIAKEIVRCGGLDGKVNMALDYFDASINRVSAWTVGFRNVQKALLSALLEPADLKALQNGGNFTKLMAVQEELKTLPFGEVWNEYCRVCGAPADGEWFGEVERYEREVLSKR